MSKFIKLLGPAYVNGRLRQPHEGVLHLDDAEGQRLLDEKSGEDVTDDFTAHDRKETPVEGQRASEALAPVEHQADTTRATATAREAAKSVKKETTK